MDLASFQDLEAVKAFLQVFAVLANACMDIAPHMIFAGLHSLVGAVRFDPVLLMLTCVLERFL